VSKYKRKPKSTLFCQYRACSNVFLSQYPQSKYCSADCRQREHWQENLDREGLDRIPCLDCGLYFRQIGSHVVQVHGYSTAREYREEHGLDVKKGILPDDLKELYGTQALENGTVNNLKKGQKFWFKKNDPKAGKYERSLETMQRLKILNKYRKAK
jgi:hypothetical protein